MLRLTILATLLGASLASAVEVAPSGVPMMVFPNADHYRQGREKVDAQKQARQAQIDKINAEYRNAEYQFRMTRANLADVPGFEQLVEKHQAYLRQLSAMRKQLETEQYNIEANFDPMY